MSLDDSNWAKLFAHRPMRDLAAYLTSYNMESQVIALDAAPADIQSTGTKQCMINGVYIPALTADDALDISADTTTQDNCINASGLVITTLYEQYFVVLAKADGTLSMWKAGEQATIAGGLVELKIPHFDPTLYCCVAIVKIAKDDAGDLTIGTTALTGDATFYQVIGPVFPHPDNFDNN